VAMGTRQKVPAFKTKRVSNTSETKCFDDLDIAGRLVVNTF
jgi:hypothetical protein